MSAVVDGKLRHGKAGTIARRGADGAAQGAQIASRSVAGVLAANPMPCWARRPTAKRGGRSEDRETVSNTVGLLLIWFLIASVLAFVVIVEQLARRRPNTTIGRLCKRIDDFIERLPEG
ncbi:MAG TPA: hypothetical protein VM537_14170 [Anaerolineae bacterium]|nr:hypothetical protein [Anaerolineae bacterium]